MKISWIFLIIFIALILLINSCQKTTNDIPVMLSINPHTPTPGSTVTIVVDTSFNIGVTLAGISIDGVIVHSGNSVPLTYQWQPLEAKQYKIQGFVENIFGQKGAREVIVKVIDTTNPIIQSLSVLPQYPEENSPAYLSLVVKDPEGAPLKVEVTIGSISRVIETTERAIVVPLPSLPQGTYPLNVLISTSNIAMTATSTILSVLPKDTSSPQISLSFAKKVFIKKEPVTAKVLVQDDTQINSINVEVDGKNVYSKTFGKADSVDLALMLGTFNDSGYHSVTVISTDGRGKTSAKGDYFAVGTGPADVKLKVSNNTPVPDELVKLEAITNELSVKKVSFSVDSTSLTPAASFTAFWKATLPPTHTLSVFLETDDGRVGLDAVQVYVADYEPPKIDSFSIGPHSLKEGAITIINRGYYTIKLSVSDSSGLPSTPSINIAFSPTPLLPPYTPPPTGYLVPLVLSSMTPDTKKAEYIGAEDLTKLATGTYYVVPLGIIDIYNNPVKIKQFEIVLK
ncbi:hypothetical protein [Pseudothermotoga sp.]|nr:hypothetical protein [Pseudothermotoga sp.]MDW8140309.1 hypothetical protein [Pseudothermotoga sp.]